MAKVEPMVNDQTAEFASVKMSNTSKFFSVIAVKKRSSEIFTDAQASF